MPTENNTNQNNDNNLTNKFDEAFNKSSKVTQDYILSEKFEENIKLICKIEKLDDEKSNIIIENLAVSILIGVLPISEAKTMLMDSFKSSGILIEDLTAGSIIKNIDAYILSDIRKKILGSETTKEIRHLTLRENNEEKEKEELRKILLEKTGNITGKGDAFAYKNVVPKTTDIKIEEGVEKNTLVNRDSLLEKFNLKNLSDEEKIKERMINIKKDEEERIQKIKEEKENDQKEYLEREKNTIKNTEKQDENIEVKEVEENENISKEFAQKLEEKLQENDNINSVVIEKNRNNIINNSNSYSREINNTSESSSDFDPYRENI